MISYLHPIIHVNVEKDIISKINSVMYYVAMDTMVVKIVMMAISSMVMGVRPIVNGRIISSVKMYTIPTPNVDLI